MTFSRIIPGFFVATAITFTGTVPVQAVTVNDNISVSKPVLRGKCHRSGGTFTEESNGTYRCVVNNGGSTTVVSCKRGKCGGVTTKLNSGGFSRPAPSTGVLVRP